MAADGVSALYGGVTTVVPMIMAEGSYVPLVRDLIEWGNAKSPVDFALTPIIHTDQHVAEIPQLFTMGTASFKHFFTAFKGEEGRQVSLSSVDEGQFFRSLETIRDCGGPAFAMCHAEDCDLYRIFVDRVKSSGQDGLGAWADARPPFTEFVRIEMASALAFEANAPLYFVHLSTGKSVEIVQKYKQKGARLSAEAVIHTLTAFREQDEMGVWGKFVPPLRSREEIKPLWDGIRSGVIDTVATDHCTYTLEDKEGKGGKFGSIWDVPPGISNVQEHWLPVLWTDGVQTGQITVQDVARLCAENAARRFGLYPKKGAIVPGADADLVIVDDTTSCTVDQNFYHGRDSRFSIYQGRKLVGRPKLTMLRGRTVMRDGQYLGGQTGRFVHAKLRHSGASSQLASIH
jgi:dihydropyrimidinase/dihydroorotase